MDRNVYVDDAFITIDFKRPPKFRHLTPTDIDQVIYVPVTLQVNAMDNVITTQEDVMSRYDVTAESDFTIFAEAPKDSFFNFPVQWNYRLVRSVDGEIHIKDAGVSDQEQIVNVQSLLSFMGQQANSTRFMHYKQAKEFFKYSFKVDAYGINSTRQQLWAVYLDRNTGAPHPYMTYNVDPLHIQGEQKYFLYADVPPGLQQQIEDGNSYDDGRLDIICPPDPEFLQHGPLAYQYLIDVSGNYIPHIRNVPGITNYSPLQFVKFNQYQADLALLLYYVIMPHDDSPYTGDTMKIAYLSHQCNKTPRRDYPVPSSTLLHDLGDTSMHFVFQNSVEPGVVYNNTDNTAPIMMFPTSAFAVSTSTSEEGVEKIRLPLQYDLLNQAKVDDHRKLNLGGRLMQLVSMYMFDASSERELGFFPNLLSEAYALTAKLIRELASKIQYMPSVRESILQQILIKHGRRYFDEYNSFKDDSVASVSDVVSKIDELFIFFYVTLTTTISNISKFDVDNITIHNIPVVIRIS